MGSMWKQNAGEVMWNGNSIFKESLKASILLRLQEEKFWKAGKLVEIEMEAYLRDIDETEGQVCQVLSFHTGFGRIQ